MQTQSLNQHYIGELLRDRNAARLRMAQLQFLPHVAQEASASPPGPILWWNGNSW